MECSSQSRVSKRPHNFGKGRAILRQPAGALRHQQLKAFGKVQGLQGPEHGPSSVLVGSNSELAPHAAWAGHGFPSHHPTKQLEENDAVGEHVSRLCHVNLNASLSWGLVHWHNRSRDFWRVVLFAAPGRASDAAKSAATVTSPAPRRESREEFSKTERQAAIGSLQLSQICLLNLKSK